MLLTQLARIPGFGRLWRSFPLGSPELRTRFDIWSHPAYAYGVWRAVDLARSLGLDGITVAEFGVAGGSGLVALENIADAMATHFGVDIEVLGFDTGTGNPAPADFRDLPYVWAEGFYRMAFAGCASARGRETSRSTSCTISSTRSTPGTSRRRASSTSSSS